LRLCHCPDRALWADLDDAAITFATGGKQTCGIAARLAQQSQERHSALPVPRDNLPSAGQLVLPSEGAEAQPGLHAPDQAPRPDQHQRLTVDGIGDGPQAHKDFRHGAQILGRLKIHV
jgi:hypothetical protein